MWGVFRSIGRFFKRQAKTKTGKAALTGLVGVGLGAVSGELGGVEAVTAAANALLFMFLRDGAAKKEQDDGV
jgi:hypothetical protein